MQLITKPWGHEKLIINHLYQVKELFMKKDNRCSLQYHNFKHETVYLVSGKLQVEMQDTTVILEPGDYVIIPTKVTHRMTALEDSVYLECSTAGPQTDVVRLQDDYNR